PGDELASLAQRAQAPLRSGDLAGRAHHGLALLLALGSSREPPARLHVHVRRAGGTVVLAPPYRDVLPLDAIAFELVLDAPLGFIEDLEPEHERAARELGDERVELGLHVPDLRVDLVAH